MRARARLLPVHDREWSRLWRHSATTPGAAPPRVADRATQSLAEGVRPFVKSRLALANLDAARKSAERRLEPEPAQSSVVGVVDDPASAGGESKHSDVAAALMCMGSSDAAVPYPSSGVCGTRASWCCRSRCSSRSRWF